MEMKFNQQKNTLQIFLMFLIVTIIAIVTIKFYTLPKVLILIALSAITTAFGTIYFYDKQLDNDISEMQEETTRQLDLAMKQLEDCSELNQELKATLREADELKQEYKKKINDIEKK